MRPSLAAATVRPSNPGAGGDGSRPASAVRLARTAGLLYLVVAIFGGFAQIVRVTSMARACTPNG
jgi:hypothetical protein